MHWYLDSDGIYAVRGDRRYRPKYRPTVRDGDITSWAVYDVEVCEGDRKWLCRGAVSDGGAFGQKPLSHVQAQIATVRDLLDRMFEEDTPQSENTLPLCWIA